MYAMGAFYPKSGAALAPGPGIIYSGSMKRLPILVVLAAVLLGAGFYFWQSRSGSGVPSVSTSVDFIRQIGELHVLRASVKEIVTSKIGDASWIKTPGKLAIICHFDIKYKYNLQKARVVAGSREDGSRYCMIHLPRHDIGRQLEHEVFAPVGHRNQLPLSQQLGDLGLGVNVRTHQHGDVDAVLSESVVQLGRPGEHVIAQNVVDAIQHVR